MTVGKQGQSAKYDPMPAGQVKVLSCKLGFFCSVKCPGELILKTYDLAKALRDTSITVVSGFHSPMEQECLNILLKGTQPVIFCPARSTETMRLPAAWKKAVQEGRLQICSPFPAGCKRMTKKNAEIRNRFAADLADKVFVSYAAPGGKTEALCRQLLSECKPVYTFDSQHNHWLIEAGALAIRSIRQ